MAAKLPIDDSLLKQLQEAGELQVEDPHGIPLVLMTMIARQQLQQATFVDSDLTDNEMMALGAEQLSDTKGWGAADMDVYDTMEGIDPSTNGSS